MFGEPANIPTADFNFLTKVYVENQDRHLGAELFALAHADLGFRGFVQ